jgi:hypothetical protein
MHESLETPKFLKCDDGFKKKRVRVCLGLAFLTFQNVLIPNTHSLSSLTQKHLLFPFLSCYPLAFAEKQLLVFRKKKEEERKQKQSTQEKNAQLSFYINPNICSHQRAPGLCVFNDWFKPRSGS